MLFVLAQRPAAPNVASSLTSMSDGGAGGGSDPGSLDAGESNRVRTFLPNPKSAGLRTRDGVNGGGVAALLLLWPGVLGTLEGAGVGALLDLDVWISICSAGTSASTS